MSRPRPAAGFSLIELIIAVSMSTIVLLGLFSLMSSMVQTEVEAARDGTVTAWSLSSIDQMGTQLSGSSTVIYPPVNSGGQTLVFCSDWTTLTNPAGPVDANPSNVMTYYYCYDSSAHVLRYKTASGSCPPTSLTVPTCDVSNYPASANTFGGVVATGFYLTNSQPPFTTITPNKVHLQYTIGNPNPGVAAGGGTESMTNPQTIAFDTEIILEN